MKTFLARVLLTSVLTLGFLLGIGLLVLVTLGLLQILLGIEGYFAVISWLAVAAAYFIALMAGEHLPANVLGLLLTLGRGNPRELTHFWEDPFETSQRRRVERHDLDGIVNPATGLMMTNSLDAAGNPFGSDLNDRTGEINPATGLPMVGEVDTEGNPYGAGTNWNTADQRVGFNDWPDKSSGNDSFSSDAGSNFDSGAPFDSDRG